MRNLDGDRRPRLATKPDRNSEDFKQLLESRKKVLQLADYIIPGHGDCFKA